MDIKEARTPDLVDELKRRTAHGIIIMAVPDDGNVSDTVVYTWGSRPWIVGVLHTAALQKTQDLINSSVPPEPETDDDTD